jgi:hypothetical protein
MSITDLIPLQYRFLAAVLAIAVLMLASAAGGAWVSGALWAADLAEAKQTHAQALAAIEHRQTQAQAQARSEEQRRQTALEGIRTDASEQIEQAQADAAAATARAHSLQQQAARVAARPSCTTDNPGAALGSPSANAPALLLADVLSRIDARAGELAATADRARIAGAACERSYDSLKIP